MDDLCETPNPSPCGLATHHTPPLRGARFQPASDIVICKPSVVIVVWSSSATIAPGQAQWHPDPPFPLVAILISEVTSFSCAIVNVLASRLPQEGSDSAQLIIQRWLSFSGFIVRGYCRRGGELIKRAGSTMCFVRHWGPGLYLLFDAMKYCFSSEGSQKGLTNPIFFLWFYLIFFHHCPYWGNIISQMQGGQLPLPTGLMLSIHVFRECLLEEAQALVLCLLLWFQNEENVGYLTPSCLKVLQSYNLQHGWVRFQIHFIWSAILKCWCFQLPPKQNCSINYYINTL